MKILAIIGALIFPPLGVILNGNNVGTVLLNLVLTFLFWIPGLRTVAIKYKEI